jgi:hypothetical protein
MYGGGGECNYRVLVWKLKEWDYLEVLRLGE